MLFLLAFFRWLIRISILVFVTGIFCFLWIKEDNRKDVFSDISRLPAVRTAVVLGTSKYLGGGSVNLYFTYRMLAAGKLYASGKVKKFILSGDNRTVDYNEPREMKKALMRMGIPDSCLIPDYAGIRTFDSMVRAKEVFGQDSVIVVSQEFHVERALFIAERTGIKAFGYCAAEVTSQSTWKVMTREFFSRMKCVLDLYVFDTRPKHLGEKVRI